MTPINVSQDTARSSREKAQEQHLQGLCSLSTSILWECLLHSHGHAAHALAIFIQQAS